MKKRNVDDSVVGSHAQCYTRAHAVHHGMTHASDTVPHCPALSRTVPHCPAQLSHTVLHCPHCTALFRIDPQCTHCRTTAITSHYKSADMYHACHVRQIMSSFSDIQLTATYFSQTTYKSVRTHTHRYDLHTNVTN